MPNAPGEAPMLACVKKRVKDSQGLPVGVAHGNPMLDSRLYEVEFMDVHTTQLLKNQITENLFATIDGAGNRFVLINDIINHRTPAEALSKEDVYFTTHTGRKNWRRTTKGWDLLFQWKDRSNDWIALKDAKESNPIKVAQCALNKKLSDEPAFAWWINTIMKQKKRLIQKVKSKY